MTSSFASVCSDISEHGGDTRAFTEADWNETASETYLPYHASKVRAERRAYEIEKEARGAWTLATICPPVRRRSGSRERERAKEREGERKEKTRRLVHPRSSSFLFLQKNEKTVFLQIVQGPPVGNIKTETIGLQRRLLSGAHYPWVPRIGMAFVDVDDVAFAHCNAAFAPNPTEIEQARAIVAAWAEARAQGKGICVLGGKLIEKLHVEDAERLLQLHEAIEAQTESGANSPSAAA